MVGIGKLKKGGDHMKNCIICGEATKHPSYDFCEDCFNSSIEELDRKYRQKEGPSGPGMDTGEAPASNPLTEKLTSHRLS
jgi:hypothetical protein